MATFDPSLEDVGVSLGQPGGWDAFADTEDVGVSSDEIDFSMGGGGQPGPAFGGHIGAGVGYDVSGQTTGGGDAQLNAIVAAVKEGVKQAIGTSGTTSPLANRFKTAQKQAEESSLGGRERSGLWNTA